MTRLCNFEVTGKVADLLTVSGIDALAKADIRSLSEQNITELAQLLKQFDAELPVEMLPQSINMSTGIQGSLKQLSLVDIQGEVIDEGVKVALDGAVENVLVPTGVKVNLSLDSDSIEKLSKYAGSELPQTDPLKVLVALTEDASKHPNFTLHAETGGANVDINGALKSLALPEEIELGISVKAKSVSDFNQLAQKELPDQGPLDLSAKLKLQLQKKSYAVNDLKVSLKDQTAKGNLALKLPESDAKPTVVNGKLDISLLDLSFLAPQADEVPVEGDTPAPATEPVPNEDEKTEVAETEKAKSDTADTSERLFSDKPVLYEKLHDYDIDLAVNVSDIKFAKSDLKDVQLVVKLKDGLLVADPITGAGGAGKINGVIRIDGQTQLPGMDVDINIVEVPMPNLGGKLDFDADLVGKGKSVAELMGSLNGNMLVVMRDGKIEGALVQKFGSGLLSFAKDKGYTELECGILRVDVKDGIANFDKRLAAQLTEVTWRGGGEIDLKTEKLGIGIAAQPRKGIPISISGELSSLMYIGGTLKHPRMQLNPKDVAFKYAKYSAYIATGGLSYLAEVIKDKIDANRDVCELILDGTVFEAMDKEDEKAKKKAQKDAEKAEKKNSE